MATTADYTPVASRNRLRFLQQLCRPRGGADRGLDDKPDAIVCIPGPDGRENIGSQQILHYLTTGTSGSSLALPPVVDELDDCVLVISCDAVAVFYPHTAKARLAPHLAVWRNCTHFTVKEVEAENVEAAELFKIKAFVHMVKPFERVGVPLTPGWSSNPKKPPADPTATTQFEMEEWPLVQAFGLADMGTGGFFTMQHKVVDVTQRLRAVYEAVDAHYFKQLAYDTAPTIVKHWDTFTAVMGVMKTPSRRLAVTEEVAGNALVTSYTFGRINASIAAGSDAAPPGHGARVLFGTHSNDLDAGVSGELTPATAGIAGDAAVHMTAEAEDPATSVRVARTYMLRAGDVALVKGLPPVEYDHFFEPPAKEGGAAGAYGAAGGDDGGGAAGAAATASGAAATAAAASAPEATVTVGENVDSDAGTRDVRHVAALYALVLRALRGAVAELGTADMSTAPARCLGAAFDAFAPPEDGSALPLPADFELDENLHVNVDGFDSFGADQFVAGAGGAEIFNGGRLQVYVRVSLTNVPSLEHPGSVLGGIVAGDTVLVDVDVTTPQAPFVLTSGVEYWRAYVAGGEEEQSVLAIERGLGSGPARERVLGLGNASAPAVHGAVLLTGGSEQATLTGTLRVFKTGLAFTNDGRGPLPLSALTHMDAVDVIPGARAAAAAGLDAPGSAVLEAARARWAEEGHGPGEASERDDPFPSPDDVLLIRLKPGAPVFSRDPAVQNGDGYVALLLPAASQSHSVQQAVLAALPGWQKEVAFAKRMAAHDAADAAEGGAEAAADGSGSTVEDAREQLELPACLHAAYRAGTLVAWQATWACRGAIERCLLDDSARRIHGATTAAVASGVASEAPRRGTVPVTIVVGPPGGGKSRFAAQLAHTSSDDNVWAVVQQPLSRGIAFRASELQGDIVKAVEDARSRAEGTRLTPRVVVVAPGFADVAVVARTVTFASSDAYVSSCVACLHVKNLFADHRHTRWLPRLLEQLSRGFVHHIALCGCEDGDDADIAALKAAVRLTNPDAGIFRLTGGLGRPYNMSPDVIPTILDDTRYRAPRAVTLRALSCPGWDAPETKLPSVLKSGKTFAESAEEQAATDDQRQRWREVEARIEGVRPLDDVVSHAVVSAPVAYSRRRLEKVLRRMVRPAFDPVAALLELPFDAELPLADIDDPWAALPAVWRAKGVVRFTDEPSVRYQVDAVPGVVRFSRAEPRTPAATTEASVLMFVGPNVDAKGVETVAARCRPVLPSQRPLRERSSITAAERAAVRDANLHAPLPDAVWFDGSRFVDYAGTPSQYHPHMADFIDAYFDKVNASAKEFNERVAAVEAAAAREAAGGGLDEARPWWRDARVLRRAPPTSAVGAAEASAAAVAAAAAAASDGAAAAAVAVAAAPGPAGSPSAGGGVVGKEEDKDAVDDSESDSDGDDDDLKDLLVSATERLAAAKAKADKEAARTKRGSSSGRARPSTARARPGSAASAARPVGGGAAMASAGDRRRRASEIAASRHRPASASVRRSTTASKAAASSAAASGGASESKDTEEGKGAEV